MSAGHTAGLSVVLSSPSVQGGEHKLNAGSLRTQFGLKHVASSWRLHDEEGKV